MPSPQDQIEGYLLTGEHDRLFTTWPGVDLLARAERAYADLRRALVLEVKARTAHVTLTEAPVDLDVVTFTRKKVEPMVRGLFPTTEQQTVLDMLGRSVVFLMPGTIQPVLNETPDLMTAWRLANIYLLSCGSKLLADDAPPIVGLSAGTTCYVAMDYFRPNGRFDDFLVHEAAHVFHNCKRRTIGLPETRRREWLLDIEFRKRETFAYACEAYSRILEVGNSPAERRKLLLEVENGPMPPDERVDARDYIDVLRTAVAARNGWKRILAACAPPQRKSAASQDRAP